MMNKYVKYKLSHGITKTYWYPELKNKCNICGMEFTPPKNRPYQEYCNNPECLKERDRRKQKKFYEKHKEQLLETARIDRQQHLEKHKEANRKFDASIKRKILNLKIRDYRLKTSTE